MLQKKIESAATSVRLFLEIFERFAFHYFSFLHLAACDVVCLPLRGWIGLVEVSGIGRFCQSPSLEEAVLLGPGCAGD